MLKLHQVLISALVWCLGGKYSREVGFAEDSTLAVFAQPDVDRDPVDTLF